MSRSRHRPPNTWHDPADVVLDAPPSRVDRMDAGAGWRPPGDDLDPVRRQRRPLGESRRLAHRDDGDAVVGRLPAGRDRDQARSVPLGAGVPARSRGGLPVPGRRSCRDPCLSLAPRDRPRGLLPGPGLDARRAVDPGDAGPLRPRPAPSPGTRCDHGRRQRTRLVDAGLVGLGRQPVAAHGDAAGHRRHGLGRFTLPGGVVGHSGCLRGRRSVGTPARVTDRRRPRARRLGTPTHPSPGPVRRGRERRLPRRRHGMEPLGVRRVGPRGRLRLGRRLRHEGCRG